MKPVALAAVIVAALLLPALLALGIWKLYTRHLDNMEYMKFEETQKKAQ